MKPKRVRTLITVVSPVSQAVTLTKSEFMANQQDMQQFTTIEDLDKWATENGLEDDSQVKIRRFEINWEELRVVFGLPEISEQYLNTTEKSIRGSNDRLGKNNHHGCISV